MNVATVSEYIVGNYISADRSNTKTFIPFLEKLCKKHSVKRVVVDSGYESEGNYHYVDESEQLSLFAKPADHEQKKKRKCKNDIGRRENMSYDAEKDEYICAQGKKLEAVATTKRKSETGYQQEVTVYECVGCKGSLVKEKCRKQKKSGKTPLGRQDEVAECFQIFCPAAYSNGAKDFHRGRNPASSKPLHPGRGCVCSGQRGYEFQTLYDAGPQECIC